MWLRLYAKHLGLERLYHATRPKMPIKSSQVVRLWCSLWFVSHLQHFLLQVYIKYWCFFNLIFSHFPHFSNRSMGIITVSCCVSILKRINFVNFFSCYFLNEYWFFFFCCYCLTQFDSWWNFRMNYYLLLKNEKMFLKSDICLLWPATVVLGFKWSNSCECICPQKDTRKSVYSSFIHNSPKLETT